MDIHQRTKADNLWYPGAITKMRFYVLLYYIYINDQSYELNKNINKDVLWFFIKLVLQKITKTHDNVCCALTPRYNLLQEKQ